MNKINQKGLFSITNDNIKYFRNKNKYNKNVKIMKLVLGATALLTAGFLGGFLATGTSTLGWLAIGLGVTSICNGVTLSYFNHEKKLCDKFWKQLKATIKATYGPGVRGLRVVKGKNYSTLREAEITGRKHYVDNGVLKTREEIFYDEKYKEGIDSSQDILVAKVNGRDTYLFAIEENKFRYVDQVPSMHSDKLGEMIPNTKTGFRIVYGAAIRPDDTVSYERPKTRKRIKKKPQGK